MVKGQIKIKIDYAGMKSEGALNPWILEYGMGESQFVRLPKPSFCRPKSEKPLGFNVLLLPPLSAASKISFFHNCLQPANLFFFIAPCQHRTF
jgi:hypothetical protein